MGIAADHCEEMAVTAESSLDDLKRRGGRLQGEIVEVGPSGLDVGVRYVEQKIEEEYGSLRGAVWRAPGPFDPAAVAAVIASMAVRFEECEHEWLDRPESDTRECLVCGREDWQ